MGFKVTNITNTLNKRDGYLNKPLNIEYFDGLELKNKKIEVGEEIIVESNRLPVSIHTYRAKGYLRVVPISENQLNAEKTNFETKFITEIPEEILPTKIKEAKIKQIQKKEKQPIKTQPTGKKIEIDPITEESS